MQVTAAPFLAHHSHLAVHEHGEEPVAELGEAVGLGSFCCMVCAEIREIPTISVAIGA